MNCQGLCEKSKSVGRLRLIALCSFTVAKNTVENRRKNSWWQGQTIENVNKELQPIEKCPRFSLPVASYWEWYPSAEGLRDGHSPPSEGSNPMHNEIHSYFNHACVFVFFQIDRWYRTARLGMLSKNSALFDKLDFFKRELLWHHKYPPGRKRKTPISKQRKLCISHMLFLQCILHFVSKTNFALCFSLF